MSYQVFVYLDELLLIRETFDRHLLFPREVALLMRGAGLTLNIRKGKFVMRKVRYLGIIIGNRTIWTDPRPETVKQLQKFLEICEGYQQFVSNYASLTAPLENILQFCWFEEAILAYDALKMASVLHSLDFFKPFAIHCDVSRSGIGSSLLMQKTEEGNEAPIVCTPGSLLRLSETKKRGMLDSGERSAHRR